MKKLELPDDVKEYINRYRELNIGNSKVNTPYFRNVKRIRGGLRSLLGKGSPEEIVEEVGIYAMLRGFELKKSNAEQIRAFMESQGIGIDCSGFVAQVLNFWLRSRGKGYIARHLNYPKISLPRLIIAKVRYIENISANLLCGDLNAEKVSLNDIRPGDLLRTKGIKHGHHILMISEVLLNESNQPVEFTYVQSAEKYGKQNGIKYGTVEITDLKAELSGQKWLEVDENGVNWTREGLLKDYEDNGLRRLKFSNLLV